MSALKEDDRQCLDAFRRAARQVRSASIIDTGRYATVRGRSSDSGKMQLEVGLLDNEAFRSLAMAVRLVYQSNEPANFGHVCNILARSGNAAASKRSADLRARYNEALDRHEFLLEVLTRGQLDGYSPRDVFDTWLYHEAFHQDKSRAADFAALSNMGDWFPLVIQRIALLLAGRVLDLDDVIADYLGEARVARIGG